MLTKCQSLLTERVYLLSYIDIFYNRWIERRDTTVHKKNKLRHEWIFSFY